jgi:hypothetical protein
LFRTARTAITAFSAAATKQISRRRLYRRVAAWVLTVIVAGAAVYVALGHPWGGA